MARVKKSISQKEKELKEIIADAKNKLTNLQNKQKTDIGELACKHGLHNVDLSILNKEFKELALKLNQR